MAFKDQRLKTKRGARDLEKFVERSMAGDFGSARSRAERYGMELVKGLLERYVTGDDRFSELLRAFLDALGDKDDALRRDIHPDQWATLWPAMNLLRGARASFLERRKEEIESRRQAEISAARVAGAGAVGAGTGGGDQ